MYQWRWQEIKLIQRDTGERNIETMTTAIHGLQPWILDFITGLGAGM